MLNIRMLVIDNLVSELRKAYDRTYGLIEPEYANIIAWTGRLALENIANTDILYHNVEHTVMVSLVGQEILRGKQLSRGGVKPDDWLHFMIAALCHDIGYVKGICRDDRKEAQAIGPGETRAIPASGTDAALTPWHVDRSKLFIQERFEGNPTIDPQRVTDYIEMTRFPPPDDEAYKDTAGYGGLLRAADFIGQLGDPDYLRKTPALFYEFEEIGTNEKIGYTNPQDMRKNYAKFFWNVVNPYIQDGLDFLSVTQEGKQWIANLHSHVFDVEHGED